MKFNEGQACMEGILRDLGVVFCTQFKFNAERNWKADFHLCESNTLLEVDGQFQGKHRSGIWTAKERARRLKRGLDLTTPLELDYLRSNAAQMQGYKMLKFSTAQVKDGRAKAWLREAGW
jgi:very-short-patch-repair endonuclease